jgi:DNA polymerase III subunit epsilon
MEDFLLTDAPLAVLDVETTGLKPEFGHRIIEISILRSEGLQEVERFTRLINPQRPLDSGAMAVNHITEDMVRDAPFFSDVLPDVERLLNGAILVGHNIAFDLSFLHAEQKRLHQPPWQGVALCTMRFARSRYTRERSYRLGSLAQSFRIPTPFAHRAEGDVLTTFALFGRFLQDLEQPTVQWWLAVQGGNAAPQASVHSLAARTQEAGPLETAIFERRTIRIWYEDGYGQQTKREVDPIICEGEYLRAFCHLRGEERSFRLDRIRRIDLL